VLASTEAVFILVGSRSCTTSITLRTTPKAAVCADYAAMIRSTRSVPLVTGTPESMENKSPSNP